MIVTLEHSEFFQQEFTQYQNKCNALPNTPNKTEIQSLMKSLLSEVQELDGQHAGLIDNKRMPGFVSESRHKILDIRKAIVKKLHEAENRR